MVILRPALSSSSFLSIGVICIKVRLSNNPAAVDIPVVIRLSQYQSSYDYDMVDSTRDASTSSIKKKKWNDNHELEWISISFIQCSELNVINISGIHITLVLISLLPAPTCSCCALLVLNPTANRNVFGVLILDHLLRSRRNL